MELINNHKQSFDELLDYFRCNLRPFTTNNAHNITDWTNLQWKYIKSGKRTYYVDVLDENGIWQRRNFYLRRNKTELCVTKEHTLFAVCYQVRYNIIFKYYVLDNSKMIGEVGN